MRILFANSYYLNYSPVQQLSPLYPPLGPLYVAAYLRRAGPWEISFFDTTFAEDEMEFAERVYAEKPHLVGIQAAITTRHHAKHMISIAKNAGATVVVGGPDPTVSCSDYLQWGADFVVLGEGEVTMAELVSHLAKAHQENIKDIKGIAYLNNNEIVLTQPRPMIKDVGQLPWPAYDLINVTPYLERCSNYYGYTEMHIVTSRGCPFTCTWCSRAVFGQTFRQRSPIDVINEMIYLQETYHVDRLWFADDTFALNKKWLESWHNELLKLNIHIPFRCMTRIDRVNPTMIGQLKDAGCYQIQLGVESGSQRVLQSMQKRTTIEQIYQASQTIRAAGIELGMFIMFGYVGEKLEDIKKTQKLLFEIKPDTVGISVAYPIPGTKFYELVKQKLRPDINERWEKTGFSYQLLFRSEFPAFYYRNLIKYILKRRSWERKRGRYHFADLMGIGWTRLIISPFEIFASLSAVYQKLFQKRYS